VRSNSQVGSIGRILGDFAPFIGLVEVMQVLHLLSWVSNTGEISDIDVTIVTADSDVSIGTDGKGSGSLGAWVFAQS